MSSQRQHNPRHLSTAARVHPEFLPQMHMQSNTRRVPSKWLATLATAMVAGYGIQTYARRVSDARMAAAEAEAEDAARRRRNEALMDEFGGRSSLQELEKAVQFYEKK